MRLSCANTLSIPESWKVFTRAQPACSYKIKAPLKAQRSARFDAKTFLDSAGVARKIVTYRRNEVIFTQGDPCDHVLYIQTGHVKLSVLSKGGREAVVAMLGTGEFFGEGCLAGQAVRMGTATAVSDSSILLVAKNKMVRLLHAKHALSDRFIAHMLARYGKHDQPVRPVPPISQGTLAEMVGTTRSRVNFFMKKFQRLGFIDYRNGLKVNNSLLTIVLHD
jgi:CRP-like cAMP-binding protein